MIRILTSILLLTAPILAADPSAAVHAAAEGWYRAAIQQDAAALDKFLADDLSYCHAGGKMQTKAEYIAAVMHGPSHYESMTYGDVQIKVYGETAVLTAFADVKLVNTPMFRVRTLQVFVEKDGQWQLAAHESTRITPAK